MDIDRPISPAIRNNDAPVEDMFGELEKFADAIGGPAWIKRRALETSMVRSLTLYMNEDYECTNPTSANFLEEDTGEEVEIAFNARRIPDDEDEASHFTTSYELSHKTSLPISDARAIPEQYAFELRELLFYSEENDNVDIATIPLKNLTETNQTIYRIDENFCEIALSQFISYSAVDSDDNKVSVDGAHYDSEDVTSELLYRNDDESIIERIPKNDHVDIDAFTDTSERLQVAGELSRVVDIDAEHMEIGDQLMEARAIRILGLLSLISCNVKLH